MDAWESADPAIYDARTRGDSGPVRRRTRPAFKLLVDFCHLLNSANEGGIRSYLRHPFITRCSKIRLVWITLCEIPGNFVSSVDQKLPSQEAQSDHEVAVFYRA